MAKKAVAKAKEKTISLESILMNCRDNLRGSASLNDKRDIMLTLVFLRFIGEKFEDAMNANLAKIAEEGMDINDPAIVAAFIEPSSFVGATYLDETSRWSYLLGKKATELNAALDDAIRSINNISTLKGSVEEGLFTRVNLEPSVIKGVVDEINKISHKTFGTERDLIGRVYEYFLHSFAIKATKEDGEFYTPHDIVELIAAFIEPYDGTLYDPCCGSGGMFIQCAKYVEEKQGDINMINVYGQESEPATYRLAKMNLGVRGLSNHLGETNASTFTNDQHKGKWFNYIMANPPFNLKKWNDDGKLDNDPRWSDYSTPPASNANYAWILHILSKMEATKGIAGFLLANGALGDDDTASIRQKLIENDKIEAIVVLPRELFYTTDISVTLWILNNNKKGGNWHGRKQRNREKEILFMDLRQWTENSVSGEQKKKVKFDSDQVAKAVEIYQKWQADGTDGKTYAEPELFKSVDIAEIEQQGWSLVPSRYIEFVDRDSNIDYNAVLTESAKVVSDLLKRQEQNQTALRNAFNTLGYECK